MVKVSRRTLNQRKPAVPLPKSHTLMVKQWPMTISKIAISRRWEEKKKNKTIPLAKGKCQKKTRRRL